MIKKFLTMGEYSFVKVKRMDTTEDEYILVYERRASYGSKTIVAEFDKYDIERITKEWQSTR